MESTHGRGMRATIEGLKASCMRLDLDPEIKALRKEGTYREFGRDAKTLVKYPGFKAVLTALKAGTIIKEHKAAGPITIHALDGQMRIHLGEQVIDLGAGQMLVLDRNMPHDVEAQRDSAFLVTLAG